MKRLVTTLAVAIGLLNLMLAPSVTQNWPQRPIRMIVPFPAGGGTDVVARMVAKSLSERLQQPVIVENRGGANGSIGLQALKQFSAFPIRSIQSIRISFFGCRLFCPLSMIWPIRLRRSFLQMVLPRSTLIAACNAIATIREAPYRRARASRART